MKSIVIFILLLSFAIRPIYFVGNVLYYQLNIDYIIETYCVNKDKPELQCNGKCHLAKQLTTTTTADDEGKAILSLYDSFFPVFSEKFSTVNLNAKIFYTDRENMVSYVPNYTFNFVYLHFKPPIA
ncbi:hypothetical protein [Winogradskyella luteola]|uniref:Uncharacterized protein n=1 Tax=Winogradskyella luteola TaxID=2828330 RepID=A0A9X1F7E8_9FLAO|nr:hypothetical protein [Winogradskyella luteola]MBV7267828.1 hypothetical protein [Winogradskyella luteola]